jgi:hypothetical protein
MVITFKDTIFVGADSRSTVYITDPNTKKQETKLLTICKIHNVGPTYYTISGYPDGYIHNFIQNNLGKYSNINDFFPFFDSSMKAFLAAHLEKLKVSQPGRFKYFGENKICTVCFFGFNGTQIGSIEFIFNLELPIKVPAKVTSQYVTQSSYTQGLDDHLAKLKGNYPFPATPDVLLFIKNCIEYERKFHPDEIGLPIDLIYITRNGATWRTKKRNCN